MTKILITGATGELGGLTIDHLLKEKNVANEEIIALARKKNEKLDEKRIEVRIGSYDDVNSLNEAFKQVDKLVIIPTQELDTSIRMEQLINVVLSAKKQNIKHIVYVSFSKPEDKLFGVEDVDIAIEHILFSFNIPYTILRNPVYFDELRHDLKIAKNTGKLLSATKNKKLNYSLKTDLALAIATVLTEKNHENKLYDLSSHELISYSELAELLSEITGEKITYEEKAENEVIKNMIDCGVSDDAAHLLVDYFHKLIAENKFNYTSNDLLTLLNSNVTSKKESIKLLLD